MLPVLQYESLDSTNREAKRLWESRKGPPEGFYVLARVQTAGKGRMGRVWQSPEGGLWVTLARPLPSRPERYQGVSLAAGLAASLAVEEAAGLPNRIKWPNDLFAGDRKFCGILCEMIPAPPRPVLLAGVGINANFPAREIRGELLHPATTLLEETGGETDLEVLLRALGRRLEEALERVDREGLAPLLPELEERLAYRDRAVEIGLPGGEIRRGVFLGVDPRGRALLQTVRGREAFLSGDLLPLSRAE